MKDNVERVGYSYTFPCQIPLHIFFRSSTALTIWNGIIIIQDVLWKIMNTESPKQVMQSDKIPALINNTLWDYLIYRCSSVVKVRNMKGVIGKIRGNTMYGLKRRSMKVERNPCAMRFQTKQQITVLRQIFGDFSTLGCRRRRPKLNCEETLNHNNKINVMLGVEEEEVPFRNKTSQTCVDIGRDDIGCYVQVVYDSYVYSADRLLNYVDGERRYHRRCVHLRNDDITPSLRQC